MKLPFPRRQLTAFHRAGDFHDGVIGPVLLTVHELHVFEGDDVIVVVQGIVHEIV